MKECFDAAVVGGGPAGAVASLCLARAGRKVVLFEASHADTNRYGETLPPEINPLLKRLGLWDALERSEPIESPGIVSCWGSETPAEVDFLCNPHGPGWHLNRGRFDAELCAAARQAGVEFRQGFTVSNCIRHNEGWLLNGLKARIVIDASGRNGFSLGGNADRELHDVLLVLILHVSYPELRPPDLRMHIEAVPSGWWYWAPVPDGAGVAMFFTGKDEYAAARAAGRPELLQAAPLTRTLVEPGRIVKARWIRATSSLRRTLYGDGWISVGDSASSYDPLSGRGIFKALRHASAAAQAVEASQNGDADALDGYDLMVRREFRDYAKQRDAHYASERRWPESPFWSERMPF